jgi:hypothetical protein
MEDKSTKGDTLTDDQKLERRLKKEHGTIYKLEVPTDEDGGVAVGYIKKMNRSTLSLVMSKIDSDPIGAMEVLLNTTWLEGDERIKTDDDVFLGACTALQEIVTIRTGSLKKI